MKILSVDDNAENLYLLESMLRGFGYGVVSARNGVEAVEKLSRERFDLIVSDILMPQMDGFELCHRVKQTEAFRNVPFIFYTATYTEKKDRELGLSLGASRFIIKPVEPKNFLEIIWEVMKEFESGKLKPAQPATEDREKLLQDYNQRLVRKLDRKVEQLEIVSRELKKTMAEKDIEISERRFAENQVRHLNSELEDRVQERTAELAVANKELEAFASAVSHDLRSPLRKIEGWAQALTEDYGNKLDEQGMDYVERIRVEDRRMRSLIDALLKLSQATHVELAEEKVNLSRFALEIGKDLQRQQADRLVEFIVAPGIEVQGDSALLRAVLQNLLDNAWKFTAKLPRARIEFGVRQQGNQREYFVRDNGAGFDMNHAAKLFAPFQRMHHVEDFPGTGIGLATVQQIILRHGGRIWAEAVVNEGATFYFTLR